MRTLPISSAPDAERDSIFPSRMVAVCGDRAWTLGQRLAAEMACEHKQVLCLCGDNCFDPYAIARFAKSQRKNSEDALGCVLVIKNAKAKKKAERVSTSNRNGLVHYDRQEYSARLKTAAKEVGIIGDEDSPKDPGRAGANHDLLFPI